MMEFLVGVASVADLGKQACRCLSMGEKRRTERHRRTEELTRDDVDMIVRTTLVQLAEQGMPELVLVGVLREQARTIERLGYLPRRMDVE